MKAEDLENKLKGREIDGWTIDTYINHGKSAAVFKAHRGSEAAAVKVFDDELIKRYGDETQFARIERELTLVGKSHPNMVSIISGGFDPATDSHYIVMDLVDGPNLAQCLEQIPVENIGTIIKELASAAKFLEELGLCHRDIKPENIVIVDNLSKLILLDFGVLRPVGVTGLTDGDELRAFIGTLQYSSPEFLLRQEEDSVEGWRALTIYQIGGVLHDLIMRKHLFSEFAQPYAALVNAVQFEQPQVQSTAVPNHLVELAGKCLLKDWRIRSNLVHWEDFFVENDLVGSTTSAKQRVTNRAALIQAQQVQRHNRPTEAPRPADLIRQTIEYLKATVRAIRSENPVLPPATINRSPADDHYLYIRFEASTKLALRQPLTLILGVQVLEALSSAVSITARAYLSEKEPASQEDAQNIIYSGVYNTASIRQALESYLYSVIDVCQQPQVYDSGEWLMITEVGQG